MVRYKHGMIQHGFRVNSTLRHTAYNEGLGSLFSTKPNTSHFYIAESKIHSISWCPQQSMHIISQVVLLIFDPMLWFWFIINSKNKAQNLVSGRRINKISSLWCGFVVRHWSVWRPSWNLDLHTSCLWTVPKLVLEMLWFSSKLLPLEPFHYHCSTPHPDAAALLALHVRSSALRLCSVRETELEEFDLT